MDPISAIAAGLLLGVVIGPELSVPWWCWTAPAIGVWLITARHHHHGALPLVALATGLACGAARPAGPALDGEVALLGVRVGAASGRTGDLALAARVDADPLVAEGLPVGRVRVRFPEAAPGPGQWVAVHGRAHPVSPALPGAPDPVRAARLAGVVTQVEARSFAVLGAKTLPPIPPELDRTGLMRAVLLGDRRGLSAGTQDVLRRTGTTHLLSISGFHVGVAAWLLDRIVGRALRVVGIGRPTGVPHGILAAAGIAGSWLYTAMAQWPVPAERAALLLSVAILGRASGRTVPVERWLWIAAATLAIAEPGSPATATYQLSFGAMFGLVWFSPWITRWWPPGLPWPVRWGIDSLGATFGASLGTLPFAAWWFQAVPPLAPVANLVALPTLGVVLVPLAGAVAVAPEPMRTPLASAGTWLCEGVLAVLAPLALDPWTPALSSLGALALGGALFVASRRFALGVPLAVVALAAKPIAPDHLRVTVLDVGQGDAALIEWPDGRRWLVDGGPASQDVVFWLRRRGVSRLDRVVQTHPDRDHARGLVAVVDALEVGELVAADLDPDLAAAAERRGVPVTWAPSDPLLRGNDRSVTVQAGPVFLAGDLEGAGEHAARARATPVPVLKVAHHGSATSSTPAFLDTLRPAVAIISVGAGNAYGHPAPEVLARLQRRGIRVLRTDRDGTVWIDVEDGQVSVRSAR